MRVALLYSGGKDSTYAIDYCRSRGSDIRYLLSVKPTRKDCFLFHFATVEHTPKLAEMLGLRHILVGCDVADPALEADIVKKEIETQQEHDPVDAVVLGGTGLQETQLRSVQDALRVMKIEVFAAHAGMDHDAVMEEMLARGYVFLITQVASDGLLPWLGKTLTKENLPQLLADSRKYGFHCGGEGGYYDTLTIDGPIFAKRLEVVGMKKLVEDAYCGHVELSLKIKEKPEAVISF